MTIKIIDTYDRSVVESLGMFTDEDASIGDRVNFPTLPPSVADQMKQHVAEGKLPATRQPEDSIVWTDTECIVTIVWLDYYSAETHRQGKQRNVQSSGLKSSVIVED
jgi:hypothetical protein